MNAQRQNRTAVRGDDQIRRINERAYRIWQQEGCPEGRSEIHWEMARELVAIEDNQFLATKASPKVHDIERDEFGRPIEPLEAVLNQGEFPTLTDQGEEQPYPTPDQSPKAPPSRQ